jgi:hypothetical protein
MGRNNEDARNGLERADMPGFEGTAAAFGNLIKSGNAIVKKRKSKDEDEDVDADAKNSRMFDGGFGVV